MRLSFIITSYNIAPWLGRCLDSLGPCLRPGDEVIVVDDGSTDGSAALIEQRAETGGFGPDIRFVPILLGANTPGGVGTAANISLREATGEAVFFVDGDDWLLPEGMQLARRAFETANTDILIANYLEHHEGSGEMRRPADAARWAPIRAAGLTGGKPVRDPDPLLETARRMALAMIAVPWRKFYRRDFLIGQGLRFPEGDFFYEDNPFHWEVCLTATSLAFSDHAICAHRIGRAGQTMAATGVELTAFFTHYHTISGMLAAQSADADLRLMLGEWLIGNMAWHLPRLRSVALWDYAMAASPAVRGIPAPHWDELSQGRFAKTAVIRAGNQLRQMAPSEVALLWLAEMDARRTTGLEQKFGALQQQITDIAAALGAMQGQLSGLAAIAEFEALQQLETGRQPAPAPTGAETGATVSKPGGKRRTAPKAGASKAGKTRRGAGTRAAGRNGR